MAPQASSGERLDSIESIGSRANKSLVSVSGKIGGSVQTVAQQYNYALGCCESKGLEYPLQWREGSDRNYCCNVVQLRFNLTLSYELTHVRATEPWTTHTGGQLISLVALTRKQFFYHL